MRETSRAEDKELQVKNNQYMGEDDYSTIMMIAGERPDIRVIASSTPTGKRGTFWKICQPESG